jgi:hypothetical protein
LNVTAQREWWQGIWGALIALVVSAAIAAVVTAIVWGIVTNAQGKRDLFRDCIQEQPPHALSDCHNAIYGYGR